MKEASFDKHGYPTEETLRTIREWPFEGKVEDLLLFVRDAWYYGERAKNVRPGIWTFSTGGWSGNEDLLEALYQSSLWDLLSWCSIQLPGGFLCIATTPRAVEEIDSLHKTIVDWAWKEKP